jgi:hypothetical protein
MNATVLHPEPSPDAGWAAIVRAQPAGHGCRSTAARNEPSI